MSDPTENKEAPVNDNSLPFSEPATTEVIGKIEVGETPEQVEVSAPPVSDNETKGMVVTIELSEEDKAEIEKIKTEFESRAAEANKQMAEKDQALEDARADIEVLKTKLTSCEEYAKIVNNDCDLLKKENDELKAAPPQVQGSSRSCDFEAAVKTVVGDVSGLAPIGKSLAKQFYDFGYADGAGK